MKVRSIFPSPIYWKILLCVVGLILGWYNVRLFFKSDSENLVKTSILDSETSAWNGQRSFDDASVADRLAKEIRILCLVETQIKQHDTNVVQIKESWGKRCNKLVFATDEIDSYTVGRAFRYINRVEKGNAWNHTRFALEFTHRRYADEFDWVILASQNSFVVVENLRFMVKDFSPEDPIVFGLNKGDDELVLNEAAIVLSKEAMGRLNKGLESGTCSEESADSMINLSRCLHAIGAVFHEAIDHEGKERIFGDNLENILDKLKSYSNYKSTFSRFPVAWSNLGHEIIRMTDYFVYQVRSYGQKEVSTDEL